MEGSGPLENLSIIGWILLKWILKKQDEELRTELICLRPGTSNGLLWAQEWAYEFTKMQCVVPHRKKKLCYFIFYFIFSDNRLWWTAEVLSSVGQTGRLDHLSFTWQQQNSWNCRKLLLGDKGNCWFMMRMHVGVLWSGSRTGYFFKPLMEADK